ncbi:MAG TPA: GTP-binding protein [Thermoplasmatales archaeon]|nr:GTP-binding protein [Thermoplasmatales archaeon]
MKKILLMGNPNVGKSALFNRLTGAKVIESNYPGTTVDYTKGYMILDGKEIEIIDVPGTFSLNPKDKAEEVAVKMLEENKGSLVICVLDSTKLERGLYLALDIIERGYPIIIALNMWDVAKDKNINIDVKELERLLGVPVVPTVAISGEGVKHLVSRIKEVRRGKIEDIVRRVQDEETESRAKMGTHR